MLYYEGRPILRWDCRDRRALDVIYGAGSAPRALDLLGRGGATTYWTVARLTGFLPNLGARPMRHILVLSSLGKREAVLGCNCLFRYWPWGRFRGHDDVACPWDGAPALLLDHGVAANGRWPTRRLRYYVRGTSDPSVLLGRCYFRLWGRERHLGYFVLTRLGGG